MNCQEKTREELLDTLRVTLAEAIEFNRAQALRAAGKGYEERYNSTLDLTQTKYIATQQPTAASHTTERMLARSAI